MLPSCYQEKPSVAAGLRVWRLAAWIRDCISGKNVMGKGVGLVLNKIALQRFSTEDGVSRA